MKKLARTGFVALTLILATCASSAVAQSAADATWQRTATSLAAYWFETFNAGELDMLMDMYAEDVDVRHLSGSVTEGLEPHRAALQGFIDNGVSFETVGGVPGYTPTASGMLGSDGAWGRWSFRGVDGEGNVVASGETTFIYRRVEGGWEIVSQTAYPVQME